MKTLTIHHVVLLIIISCAFSCKDEKYARVQLQSQRQEIGVKSIVTKPDIFYDKLVSQTSFTEEDVELLKQVEQDLITKYGLVIKGNQRKEKIKSLNMDRKLKIREALNNDTRYAEFIRFDEKQKKFSLSKGSIF